MTLSLSYAYRYVAIDGDGGIRVLSEPVNQPTVLTETNIPISPGEPSPEDYLVNGEIVYVDYPGRPQFSGQYMGQNSEGLFVTHSRPYFYSNNGGLGGATVPFNEIDATCFLEGVRLACEDGEAAVEDLSIGDRLRLSDGSLAPIRWIGRQSWASHFADPLSVLPVRIAAGALGEATPSRDLYLSPDHAVLTEGVLAHAGALVNGTTITRVDRRDLPERFRYFHIELEAHAVVLAEGCPCESFVANVSRARFENFSEYLAMFGEERTVEEMDLPRAHSTRQLPRRVSALLAAREAALGLAWASRLAG